MEMSELILHLGNQGGHRKLRVSSPSARGHADLMTWMSSPPARRHRVRGQCLILKPTKWWAQVLQQGTICQGCKDRYRLKIANKKGRKIAAWKVPGKVTIMREGKEVTQVQDSHPQRATVWDF